MAVDGGELPGRLDPQFDHVEDVRGMPSVGEDVVGDAFGRDRSAVRDERQAGALLLEVADRAVDLVGVGGAELDLDDVPDALGLVEKDDGELVGPGVDDGPLERGRPVAEAEPGRVLLDAGGQPGAGQGEGVIEGRLLRGSGAHAGIICAPDGRQLVTG